MDAMGFLFAAAVVLFLLRAALGGPPRSDRRYR